MKDEGGRTEGEGLGLCGGEKKKPAWGGLGGEYWGLGGGARGLVGFDDSVEDVDDAVGGGEVGFGDGGAADGDFVAVDFYGDFLLAHHGDFAGFEVGCGEFGGCGVGGEDGHELAAVFGLFEFVEFGCAEFGEGGVGGCEEGEGSAAFEGTDEAGFFEEGGEGFVVWGGFDDFGDGLGGGGGFGGGGAFGAGCDGGAGVGEGGEGEGSGRGEDEELAHDWRAPWGKRFEQGILPWANDGGKRGIKDEG